MGCTHDTGADAPGQSPLLTATDVTRVVTGAIFDLEGVYLGAAITRAIQAAVEAVLIDHARLTEERLRARVVAAIQTARRP